MAVLGPVVSDSDFELTVATDPIVVIARAGVNMGREGSDSPVIVQSCAALSRDGFGLRDAISRHKTMLTEMRR